MRETKGDFASDEPAATGPSGTARSTLDAGKDMVDPDGDAIVCSLAADRALTNFRETKHGPGIWSENKVAKLVSNRHPSSRLDPGRPNCKPHDTSSIPQDEECFEDCKQQERRGSRWEKMIGLVIGIHPSNPWAAVWGGDGKRRLTCYKSTE